MKKGSLVELVKDFDITSPLYYLLAIPVKNVVYTVRGVYDDDGPVILLEEIINPITEFEDGTGELWFDMWHFRELVPPILNIEEHIKENATELVII